MTNIHIVALCQDTEKMSFYSDLDFSQEAFFGSKSHVCVWQTDNETR